MQQRPPLHFWLRRAERKIFVLGSSLDRDSPERSKNCARKEKLNCSIFGRLDYEAFFFLFFRFGPRQLFDFQKDMPRQKELLGHDDFFPMS